MRYNALCRVLELRINHQWPARATDCNDTILSAEVISRETLDVPLANVCWLGAERSKSETICKWQLFFLDGCKPTADLFCA